MRTDIDHIDALVKRADPADPWSPPGPHSPEAEGIWEQVQAAMSLDTDSSSLVLRPGPMRPRRLVLPVMGVGVLAAVVFLVLQLLPNPALQPPNAAAAVLRHLARQAAAAKPTAILKSDQWIQSESQVSYLAAPAHSGPESAALQRARAVVIVNAQNWANDLGQYCSQQIVNSVEYDSPASQQAWTSSGFGVPSTPQPQCGSGFLGAGGEGLGTLDVARLPTDPAALAQVIESGTTGISALDQLRHFLTPFGRAVQLLVGPTFGATPALWSGLLRAMATMPGVALLGTQTTHSGAIGVALAGATGEGYRTTIILSPSTGALLEARNLLVGQLIGGLPFGVVTIQWIDPTGTPQVVDASMLPSSLSGQVPTGIVSAVTKPNVTLDRWNAWLHSVLPNLSAGAALTATPGVYDVSVVTHSPDPDIASIKRLFQGSGLVKRIRSATG
jgi:hypothetical protein